MSRGPENNLYEEAINLQPLLPADYQLSSNTKREQIIARTQKRTSYPNRFYVAPGTTWKNLDYKIIILHTLFLKQF